MAFKIVIKPEAKKELLEAFLKNTLTNLSGLLLTVLSRWKHLNKSEKILY
jgi:hypothetical protein